MPFLLFTLLVITICETKNYGNIKTLSQLSLHVIELYQLNGISSSFFNDEIVQKVSTGINDIIYGDFDVKEGFYAIKEGVTRSQGIKRVLWVYDKITDTTIKTIVSCGSYKCKDLGGKIDKILKSYASSLVTDRESDSEWVIGVILTKIKNFSLR